MFVCPSPWLCEQNSLTTVAEDPILVKDAQDVGKLPWEWCVV